MDIRNYGNPGSQSPYAPKPKPQTPAQQTQAYVPRPQHPVEPTQAFVPPVQHTQPQPAVRPQQQPAYHTQPQPAVRPQQPPVYHTQPQPAVRPQQPPVYHTQPQPAVRPQQHDAPRKPKENGKLVLSGKRFFGQILVDRWVLKINGEQKEIRFGKYKETIELPAGRYAVKAYTPYLGMHCMSVTEEIEILEHQTVQLRYQTVFDIYQAGKLIYDPTEPVMKR